MKIVDVTERITSDPFNLSAKDLVFYVCFWLKIEEFDELYYRFSYFVTDVPDAGEVIEWAKRSSRGNSYSVSVVLGNVEDFPAPPTEWVVISGEYPEVEEVNHGPFRGSFL
ncbi:hypothetical protein Csp1_13180 [Corynebacterium provencense]|uniref:Uncharacterized protein n=2 Tax=Corynebacterium provencense TaxID=1737425 RepID=A0A2Z3YQZ9_9CORY|nr:hypothetical protein [Corynebacterium provencense]AWT26111.1 hypothetical protein Csp1_13180 [Corynebacterium provencense]